MTEKISTAVPMAADAQTEIARLNKIIQALMNRAERNASLQGSDFNLFQTAITLEERVRSRTEQLEATKQVNEKITRALRESEKQQRLLIENAPVSIHEIDLAGRVVSMNRAGLLMHDVHTESEMLGRKYLDGVSSAERERIAELLAQACAGKTSHFEFHTAGKQERILKSSFVPIKDVNGRVEKLMGITEDITERKLAERQIREFAFNDALTHLPNRRLLHDRMKHAMAISKRNGQYGAVMVLDLDNFKPLNDEHGHDLGDLLLIEVARRLTNCVREIDTVARIGGDEFVVMLCELSSDIGSARQQAVAVAEKVRDALAEPYSLMKMQDGQHAVRVEHHCTASIGVVPFVDYEWSEKEILILADRAMYRAKESGRNAVRLSDEG